MTEMESISEFYRGRSVLVTGASGFIGKQLVEKLLRSCPDVDKIYLLLRPTRFYTAPARLQYILSSPVYSALTFTFLQLFALRCLSSHSTAPTRVHPREDRRENVGVSLSLPQE